MKRRIYHVLNESAWGSIVLTVLILASVAAFALETEYKDALMLQRLGTGFAAIFGIEYVLRVWTADVPKPGAGLRARLDYIMSVGGVIDLLAFLPAILFPAANGTLVLRLLRLLRLARLFKIASLRRAIAHVTRALRESADELAISVVVSLGLIFFGATAMFLVEGDAQPEIFGSIPRAMWWSMATLTTVGYGDVYPITVGGKMVASFIAIVGIAAVAMPAGILAAAFSKSKA